MEAPRVLTPADIPGAMRLKEAANWNQTEQDWRNVMAMEPEGCFGIECDGRLIATTTAVRYGRDLAWIGMVLTDPAFRGRGFARRLMEHALDWLRANGAGWIKLDATDMGRPLYAKLGFADECAIERWGRPPGSAPSAQAAAALNPQTFAAMDRAAFGTDRSTLLRLLGAGEAAAIPAQGYVMGRPGSKAAYFGPCVALSPAAARELVSWFVARHAHETIFWDILPENQAAVAIAQEFGFAPLRRLVRMSLAGRTDVTEFVHHDENVFAIAGFEYG